MNRDSSRKGGRGGKRRREQPTAAVEPTEAEAKSAELLQKVREQALGGLTDLVGLALATLGDCLKNGPSRAQGSRSSDARYVLDVVLDRISSPAKHADDVETDEDGKPRQTPVDELAMRRAELQKFLREQRKQADTSKTKWKGK